jgi:peroxidase
MHRLLRLLLIISVALIAHLPASRAVDPACEGLLDRRSLDGGCNNVDHADWGRVGSTLLRKAPAATLPADLPNERLVSNALFATAPHVPDPLKGMRQRRDGEDPSNDMNSLAVMLGQFLSHDTDHIVTPFIPGSPLNLGIAIPGCVCPPESPSVASVDELCVCGDTAAQSQTRLFTRPSIGVVDAQGVLQTFNNVTAYVDLNTVYGMSDAVSAKLRAFVGGRLLVGPNDTLPDNRAIGVPNECALAGPPIGSAAGDLRSDENFYITLFHTLFLRSHNRYAAQVAERQPCADDERIFRKARDLNIATFQHVVYDEWMPFFFGRSTVEKLVGPYRDYDATTQPGTFTEFASAGFRLHTLLTLPQLVIGDDCALLRGRVENVTRAPFKLQERSTCEPDIFRAYGPDAFLRGAVAQKAQRFDPKVSDGIRNLRIGGPGNVDVEASNVFRGRLHSVPAYDAYRVAFGLPSLYTFRGCEPASTPNASDPLRCFEHITRNSSLARDLRAIYRRVDRVDAFVGIMAEDTHRDSAVGVTATTAALTQLRHTRDTDRLWWENYPSHGLITSQEYHEIKAVTLAGLLRTHFPGVAAEIKSNPLKPHNNLCSD